MQMSFNVSQLPSSWLSLATETTPDATVGVAAADDEASATLALNLPWTLMAEASTFGLIWLMAVVGNVLITCTLLRRGLLTHPSNRLVFSVTLSNLIFSFCVFPCILVSTIKEQWIFGSTWCYVNAFFTILVTVASSATLAAIALDRYFAIVRPMQYSRTMTGSRANVLLTCSWCLGLICALPPCFGWSTYEYQSSYRACFLGWTSSLSYSIVLLLVTFFFPLISMLICYYAILQVARTKCKRINVGTMSDPMTPLERIHTLSTDFGATPTPLATPGLAEAGDLGAGGATVCARVTTSESQTSIGKSLRRNRFSFSGRKPSFSWLSSTSSINSTTPIKGMRTIFLVVAAFLLTWFPMLVLALLDIVSSAARLDWTPPGWLHVFAMWSMCAGSVTYPILYGMYNRAIRKELRLCLSWSPANWPLAHHLYAGQRRGSKWSNYSEYASLRPRENSSTSATTPTQKSFTDPLSCALAQAGTRYTSEHPAAGILPPPLTSCLTAVNTRKSSQDSGAVIPSDDEDGHRNSFVLAHYAAPAATPSGAVPAVDTADMCPPSWRSLKPRMALAVLTVSLQHIAAHSKYTPAEVQQLPSAVPAARNPSLLAERRAKRAARNFSSARTASLDEGIEDDSAG